MLPRIPFETLSIYTRMNLTGLLTKDIINADSFYSIVKFIFINENMLNSKLIIRRILHAVRYQDIF